MMNSNITGKNVMKSQKGSSILSKKKDTETMLKIMVGQAFMITLIGICIVMIIKQYFM